MDQESAHANLKRPEAGETGGPGVALEIRADGLAFLIFDRAGEKVNVLDASIIRVLEILVNQVTQDRRARGLIVTSAKRESFIAGADIHEIESLGSAQEAENASRRGHRLLDSLERLPFPVVAAINGACLGGGAELALACHFRVASDSGRREIGLPEVQLGIIPAGGGTQRLPRLIGLGPALDLILTGRSLDAREAWEIGLLDEIAPPERLLEAAERLVDEAIAGRRPRRKMREGPLTRLNPFRAAHIAVAVALARGRLHQRLDQEQYPAPFLALQAVAHGLRHGSEEGLRREEVFLGQLAHGITSRNLIALFSMQQKARSDPGIENPAIRPRQVRAAAVIGAGTMGGGIAQALARSGLSVRLKDIELDALGNGMRFAYGLSMADLRKNRIRRRELDRRMDLILPTLDYTGMRRADIVLEAVTESVHVKRRVLGELEEVIPEGFIFATNTSSLPIAQIAEGARRPQDVVGMHFFNPVHRMPLVEVVRGPQTSDEVLTTIVALAKRMGKTPVVVQDAPGFLVNRVLMAYLGEALLLLEEGARIDDVDEIMVAFGMPMGPFAVLDQVGIDVSENVAGVLAEALRDRVPRTTALQILREKGWLGRKSGKGFYLYRDLGTGPGDGAGRGRGAGGKKSRSAVNQAVYALASSRSRRDLDAGAVESRLVLPMVNEATRCLEAGIVRTPEDVDLAMVMGAGFPPFRGGLLHHADQLGLATVLHGLEILEALHGTRFEAARSLRDMARDGQRFFA